MNTTKQAEVQSLVEVQKYLIKFPDLMKNKEIAAESLILDSNIQKALSAGDVKGRTEEVSTDDVGVAKKLMSDTVMNLVHRGIIKCQKVPTNASLALKLKRPADYILSSTKLVAVEHATEMLTILGEKANSDYLTNILPAELTEAAVIVSSYDNIKEVPSITIKNKKDTGKTVVDQTVKDGRKNVTNLITLVKIDCSVDNPAMVTGISHAAVVLVLGVRHTPVEITVKDDTTGKIIVNAKSTEKLRTKVRILNSDQEGMILLKTHKNGTATITISNPGYDDYILKEHVEAKVLNVFEVRMKKVGG